MFSNLIESSSHAKEFKRRGSFLVFTTATYVAFFVITGVVSIYAYDTHLGEQELEVSMLLPPHEIVPDRPKQVQPTERPRNNSNNEKSSIPERAIAMLDVNHPEVVPEKISTARNPNLPLPPGAVRIGDLDDNPVPIGGGGSGTNSGRTVIQPTQVIMRDELPPTPEPTPVVQKIYRPSTVLNSIAIYLPKPPYPPLAKQIGAKGMVSVQVLIDETGKVLTAKAVSGHPLLIVDSQRAAMQARFSPTTLNGVAVKVSGIITYDFKLQP